MSNQKLRRVLAAAFLLAMIPSAGSAQGTPSVTLGRLIAQRLPETPYAIQGISPGMMFDSLYAEVAEPGAQYGCFFREGESTARCYIHPERSSAPIPSRGVDWSITVDRSTQIVLSVALSGRPAAGTDLDAAAAELVALMADEWGGQPEDLTSRCQSWGDLVMMAMVCADEEKREWRLEVHDNRIFREIERIVGPEEEELFPTRGGERYTWYPLWRPRVLGGLQAAEPFAKVRRELGLVGSPGGCAPPEHGYPGRPERVCQFLRPRFEIAGHSPARVTLEMDSATTAVTEIELEWPPLRQAQARVLYESLSSVLRKEWGHPSDESDTSISWSDFPFDSSVYMTLELLPDGSPDPNSHQVWIHLSSFAPGPAVEQLPAW